VTVTPGTYLIGALRIGSNTALHLAAGDGALPSGRERTSVQRDRPRAALRQPGAGNPDPRDRRADAGIRLRPRQPVQPRGFERHLVDRDIYREGRSVALAEWRDLAG